MDPDDLRDRAGRLAAWLDASPVELAGLAVLVVGAMAVLLAVVWTSPRDDAARVEAAGPPRLTAAPTAAATGAPTHVTVHVAGAVGREGLVQLAAGARVADAIRAAGGLAVDADTSPLNLARAVVDGERVDVPRVGDDPVPTGTAAPDAGGAGDGRVDLNRATPEQLETLPGIGPVMAARIVAWREANGPFTDVGQLREVSGIGERTFQDLAPLVRV